MANIININAEQGANYIGDDAEPALTFENSSTGPGVLAYGAVVSGTATVSTLQATSAVDIDGVLTASSGATIIGAATLTPALDLTRSVLAGPTAALLRVGASSTPSAPVLELTNTAFVSAISLDFSTSTGWAGMGAIRVKYPDQDTLGWIPILPSAQVTAAKWP
jgi:hypothetical protein